jgi:23S rRNA pseudouridine1911/1915/1917 synthase
VSPISRRAARADPAPGVSADAADPVDPTDLGDAADPALAESDGAADVELRSAIADASMHGQRLDKVLVALAPEFSRSHLQQLVERGHVQVQQRVVMQASRHVRAGEAIRLELVPTDESRAFRPEPMALSVLHEDEHVLVIDKPAGLVVHPAPGNWSGTLLNGLLARDAGAAQLPRAGIVHRLDKDTSGVMVVARTLPAMTALVRAIAAREVHRQYLALAHGVPVDADFSVDAPIGRDPRSRVRMAVVGVAAGGREARTDVRVLADRDGIAALQCTLHTGRTHQIRVHLASRGHPLVADATYGGRPALGVVRQALHAWRLAFAHPVTGVEMAFEAPLPDDLRPAWTEVAGATMPANLHRKAAGRALPPLRDDRPRRRAATAASPPPRDAAPSRRRGPRSDPTRSD